MSVSEDTAEIPILELSDKKTAPKTAPKAASLPDAKWEEIQVGDKKIKKLVEGEGGLVKIPNSLETKSSK